jgi:hypothetical protein
MSYCSKIKFRTQVLSHFETLCQWKSIAPFLKTQILDKKTISGWTLTRSHLKNRILVQDQGETEF